MTQQIKVNYFLTFPPDHGCKAAEREYGRPVKCLECPRPICVHDTGKAL